MEESRVEDFQISASENEETISFTRPQRNEDFGRATVAVRKEPVRIFIPPELETNQPEDRIFSGRFLDHMMH
ncbi:MAG: hypothetical protein Q9165_006709 [Trypethelium subeluteriae]